MLMRAVGSLCNSVPLANLHFTGVNTGRNIKCRLTLRNENAEQKCQARYDREANLELNQCKTSTDY